LGVDEIIHARGILLSRCRYQAMRRDPHPAGFIREGAPYRHMGEDLGDLLWRDDVLTHDSGVTF
jgi:hypothetical protein